MTRSIFGLRTHIMRLEPGTSPEEVTHQFTDKPRKDVVVKPSHPARQASASSARRSVTIPGTPSRPRLRIVTSSSPKMLPGPEAVSVGNYDGNSTNRSTAITEKDEEEERMETSDGNSLAAIGAGVKAVIPEVLVVTGLESANSPAMIKLVDILVKRKLDAEKEGTVPLPDNFTVIWIRDERGSDVPGWVVRTLPLGDQPTCVLIRPTGRPVRHFHFDMANGPQDASQGTTSPGHHQPESGYSDVQYDLEY